MWYNVCMKRLTIILTLFLFFINASIAAPEKTVKKDMKVLTADGFSMCATLEYPKSKQKEYSTVVFLHSLGYSSEWWEGLPEEFLDNGYAVLKIDLRGHGASVYNSKLVRLSWKSMTNTAYSKYPTDVIKVIEQVKSDNKKEFFNNWAIVGSDIGASTGVLVANKIAYKPKTIVMLSPVVSTKGLYIPVKLAELDNIDILTISGDGDTQGQNAQEYLKKFAQSQFAIYISESRSSGMIMLKKDKSLISFIKSWVDQYLK